MTPVKLEAEENRSQSQSVGVDSNRNEKKINWSEENETILVEWCDIAQCYKWLYTRSHSLYSSMHAWFTIPTIILSTISGTASFAQASLPIDYQSYATLGIGTLNILIGICATIQQYLKISELNESHRVSSISWDKFARNIRIELAKSPDERSDAGSFIKMCRHEFDRLMETSPRIPDKTISEFIHKFKGNNEEEKNRFNELKKPDICDTITTVNETRHKWYLEERIKQEKQEKTKTNEYLDRKYSFESISDNEDIKNKFSNVIISRLKDIHRKKSEGIEIENILKTQEEIDNENLEGFVDPQAAQNLDSKTNEKQTTEINKKDKEKENRFSNIQKYIQSFYDIYERYPMKEEIRDSMKNETSIFIIDEFLKSYDSNTYVV